MESTTPYAQSFCSLTQLLKEKTETSENRTQIIMSFIVNFKFIALLAFLFFYVSTHGFLSPSLSFRRQQSSGMMLSMNSASTVTVRPVNTATNSRELARCAALLATSMYPVELPRGQANELTRLELKDLEARYGATVGKRKYPSQFFVAEEDQEFLGAVGLDCQYLDNITKKLTMFRPSRTKGVNEYAEWEDTGDKGEIVVVLANLAVRLRLSCNNFPVTTSL